MVVEEGVQVDFFSVVFCCQFYYCYDVIFVVVDVVW